MKELEAIVAAYTTACQEGLTCILATVVHVEGSSYRRAGARMLIDELGRMTGAISGGCLEGDALRKALLALHQNKNKLVTYDTSDEEDAMIGAQLGCNGIIQVLFEPIDLNAPNNPIEFIKEILSLNTNAAMVSLYNLSKDENQRGTIYVETKQEVLFNNLLSDNLSNLIHQECQETIANEGSHFAVFKQGEQSENAFIQYIPKPLHLVLIGAGNDAVALSKMGQSLGWKISIQDGRTTHANESRFSANCQVIVSKPEETLNYIEINSRTFFVLMSHNYQYDNAVLKLLLNNDIVPYIGILGPSKKYQRMLADLKAEGIEPTPGTLSKIYAPIGLDLGGETPEEIALAILAEIQTLISGKKQHHLRDVDGPIHERISGSIKIVNV